MNYVMLKEVCSINMGQSPESDSYNENRKGVPFFQGNADFGERYPVTRKWCTAPTKMAKPEDILISVRAPIGAMNYAKEECCIGRGLAALTPDKTKVSPEFIFWLLKGKNEELNSKGTGSTFKAIGRKVLEETLVPDIELETQMEYSEILEKVYAVIQSRKQELQKLDELIKARFVELFGKPLLNEKGWEVKITGDVCSITDGSHFSPVGMETGYPMLSVRNMRNDGFRYDDCKLVSQEDYDVLVKQGCKPLKNDVLIAKDGSYFYYGFVVKEEIEQAVLSSIAILRPRLEEINPEYLCRYMLSSEIVDLVGKNYVTGAAIKRVILKGIKQIPVMLPPIELQNQFAVFVEQVDKSKFTYIKCIDIMRYIIMRNYIRRKQI